MVDSEQKLSLETPIHFCNCAALLSNFAIPNTIHFCLLAECWLSVFVVFLLLETNNIQLKRYGESVE